MVDIEFNLNQAITIIQARPEDTFQDAIKKYLQKVMINPNIVGFIVNGKQVNPTQTIESHMNQLNKQSKKVNVLVNTFEEDDKNKEQVFIESKDIICPQCKEPCRIKFEDNKIKLFDCDNGHITENIKIMKFPYIQKINISEILCEKCKLKNKGNCLENEFYTCLDCKKNLCLLCQSGHDRRHHIIQYDQKYYICKKHNERIISYCKKCGINICIDCEGHEDHETVFLKDIKINIEEKKNCLAEMKKLIESIDIKIKEAINILNGFSIMMKNYYDINNAIFSKYYSKNKNYQMMNNLNEISPNNKLYQQLKNINEEKDTKKIINNIMDFYSILNEDTIIKEITIIYNTLNQNEIQIFGDGFVSNNKNKCKIIIDNQKRDLCSKLKITNNKSRIEIKLEGINNITTASSMFDGCKSLISLPDIFKWDTKNLTDMRNMFSGCESLSSLPDISKWNTENVTNMTGIFSRCSSLKSLPDISKWNTKNVNYMSYMFLECKSLKSLPDISKWNTKNVTYMSYMFSDCNSLESLPDISKWEKNEYLEKDEMFGGLKRSIIPKNF